MEIALLLSLLGFGVLSAFLGHDDAETDSDKDADPNTDLMEPERPVLDDSATKVSTGDALDNRDHTTGSAYDVIADLYDVKTGSGDDIFVANDNTAGNVQLGAGNDSAWGGNGRDVIIGAAGNDMLSGGDGDDILRDTQGENRLYGGAGNDFLEASNGSVMVGGDGADQFRLVISPESDSPLRVLDFNSAEDKLTHIFLNITDGGTYDLDVVERDDGKGVNLVYQGRVTAEIFGASKDDITNVPVVVLLEGGTFMDDDAGHTIRGNSQTVETILGAGGDDVIHGGPGDRLDGGDGNDVIHAYGRFSDDASPQVEMSTVSGGAGNDIIISTNGNVITGGEGADKFGLTLSQYSGGGSGSGSELTETIITDFDPAQDSIYIHGNFIEQAGGSLDDPASSLSIAVWPDGEGADILAGDEVIAKVRGGQTLQVENLVIAVNGVEQALLGHH